MVNKYLNYVRIAQKPHAAPLQIRHQKFPQSGLII